MDAKMKECFKPHAIMHSLMGLGIGFALVSLVPALGNLLLGVVIVGVAVFLDYNRK